MVVVDVNVLIYAFRSDSPHHEACRRWLSTTLDGDDLVGLSLLVEIAFLRIATLPSLGGAPAAAVAGFLAALQAQPRVVRVEPSLGHFSNLERLARELGLVGNDWNDAHLALLALERRATLVSVDRGFARFQGLAWFDPTTT
jgi:uncharacterized protein